MAPSATCIYNFSIGSFLIGPRFSLSQNKDIIWRTSEEQNQFYWCTRSESISQLFQFCLFEFIKQVKKESPKTKQILSCQRLLMLEQFIFQNWFFENNISIRNFFRMMYKSLISNNLAFRISYNLTYYLNNLLFTQRYFDCFRIVVFFSLGEYDIPI